MLLSTVKLIGLIFKILIASVELMGCIIKSSKSCAHFKILDEFLNLWSVL